VDSKEKVSTCVVISISISLYFVHYNYGYYYSINRWNDAIETMYNAIHHHELNLNIYKTHATNLIWKHSIHNPDMQSEWRTFL